MFGFEFLNSIRAKIRKKDKNSQVLGGIYSKFISFCTNFDTLDRIISKLSQFFIQQRAKLVMLWGNDKVLKQKKNPACNT